MKNRGPKDEEPHGGKNKGRFRGPTESMHQKKKNMKRLGGGGLSLEAFAGMKSNSNQYNPALIKKQREFYKNAKYVSKYKKSLKQLNQQNNLSMPKPIEDNRADGDFNSSENKENGDSRRSNKKDRRKGSQSLKELYEKKQEEEEKARMEREAIVKAKKEERVKAEAWRKAKKEKMLKRTRRGQPVMKYRIEHLLQTVQGSTRN
ncbi:rRNA-processing protein FYV7 [Punica granatum]|uniref:Uncharacterized protein n=2 Tax=Punica granatum TaxID=22663 RepID=A0A218WZ98_PUNGR|nr:rRNA-processing protein FYV7 [Punica granatum]OWM78034.1 hypothetical protein CDL15_Pgr018603 [Punica granatum]PKI37173.1 hypothetical protein CRG98_042436 [Punica granatum]